MFRHTFILLKKELTTLFTSPTLYLLTAIFLFLMGWLFFNHLAYSQNSSIISLNTGLIVPIFGNMNFIFLFLLPLLTMRSFAEERQNQTLDLLLTSELRPFEIILAKMFSLIFMILFMMGWTLIFPIILAYIGFNDWPFFFTGLLGSFLNGWAYGMVGLFISSLTTIPLVSAVGSFFTLIILLLLSQTGVALTNPLLAQMVSGTSIVTHFFPFSQGVIAIKDLVYFATFIAYFFYLTLLSLNRRYW